MFKFKLNKDQQKPESQQQPEPLPPSENSEADLAVSSTSEPDWDNTPLPDAETAKPEVAPEKHGHGPQVIAATPEGEKYVIPYEVFHEGFTKSLQLVGHLSQLQTLTAAGDEKTCPDATRAMYDIILETPALHFMIMPGSIWVQRAFAIGSFMVPVTMATLAEIKAKQQATMEG